MECINPGWQDAEKKSNVLFSEKSMKITTKFPMGNSGEMTIIETISMLENNLVIETNSSSSYGDRTETMVFDKQ